MSISRDALQFYTLLRFYLPTFLSALIVAGRRHCYLLFSSRGNNSSFEFGARVLQPGAFTSLPNHPAGAPPPLHLLHLQRDVSPRRRRTLTPNTFGRVSGRKTSSPLCTLFASTQPKTRRRRDVHKHRRYIITARMQAACIYLLLTYIFYNLSQWRNARAEERLQLIAVWMKVFKVFGRRRRQRWRRLYSML